MRTLTCVSFIFFAAICASAQCRDVRFGKGHFSTTISGATAKQNTCYRIRAKTSQLITLHLDATDPKTTFSLSEDYYDADFKRSRLAGSHRQCRRVHDHGRRRQARHTVQAYGFDQIGEHLC